VAVRWRSRIRVQHPSIGLIELDFEILRTASEDQRLYLFTAPVGTGSAGHLDLLRVVGRETFNAP
jgi:hypothetical protein